MSPKKAPAPPDGKWSWSKVLAGIVVFIGLFGLLDGPWVGIFVGSIFVLLGLLIAMTFFGPYDRSPAAIFQAPGRLLLGALMIFLGGLALVSAISDIRPSLVWNYPNFGDLRTLFWDRDDYRAMACDRVEGGPPAALAFAVARSGPSRIECAERYGRNPSLLELADDPELFLVVLEHRQYNQDDLDRKLVAEAWRGNEHRMQVEKLVGLGANPNAEIEGSTALAAALDGHSPQLAMWLLENGAQANHVFEDGGTLLERARNVDQVHLRQLYEEMLLSHGAAVAPKLEQPPMGRAPGS